MMIYYDDLFVITHFNHNIIYDFYVIDKNKGEPKFSFISYIS